MPDDRRDALERRVWRLAYLLTGDRDGAAALVDRILGAQGHREGLGPARLDRLVIQQAREMIGVGVHYPGGAQEQEKDLAMRALKASHTLAAQPREAWVLARVDMVDELWMSRAMDCSRTAARTHLHGGE